MKLFDAEKEKMTSEHEIQLSSAVSVGCWLPLRVMPYYLKSYFFRFYTPFFLFSVLYCTNRCKKYNFVWKILCLKETY